MSAVTDINSELLHTWGYRQPYSIAHVVLCPYASEERLSDLLKIIDLVAGKGADFSWEPPSTEVGIYTNPPLIAEGPLSLYSKHTDSLRARALLWGADPCPEGRCFPISGLEYSRKLYTLALDYYYSLTRSGATPRPHPHTLKMMKAIADEREAAHKALFA